MIDDITSLGQLSSAIFPVFLSTKTGLDDMDVRNSGEGERIQSPWGCYSWQMKLGKNTWKASWMSWSRQSSKQGKQWSSYEFGYAKKIAGESGLPGGFIATYNTVTRALGQSVRVRESPVRDSLMPHMRLFSVWLCLVPNDLKVWEPNQSWVWSGLRP